MRAWWSVGALLVAAAALPCRAAPPREAPLTVEDCVSIAVGSSPELAQAESRVREWQARLQEVESAYYPKVKVLSWLAPMYTVHGSALEADVSRTWESIEDWGPSVHFEGRVVQPLWAFGRVAAGERAAGERIAAERAKVREVRDRVAFQVRELYYQRLFALTLIPTFDATLEIVRTAVARADELYEAGTGEVTQADRMKLRYGITELEKARLRSKDGGELALVALAHTMGLPADRAPTLAADRLPELTDRQLLDLPTLLAQSAARPEWEQAEHAARAAVAWEQAEERANHPVVFAAMQLEVDWTPTRTDAENPYHYDPYNGVFGGIAIGLSWDFDPALTDAKAEQARAAQDQVTALVRLAETGIPLQVRKAYRDIVRLREVARLSQEGVVATRTWMTFASTAYNAGTGDARDLLEGVGAYAKARFDYYEAIRDCLIAEAALMQAVGGMRVGRRDGAADQ